MIKFVFLNWKFKEQGHLYSTEIIEEAMVKDLIEKLEKLQNEYNLKTVHPISQIFDVYQEIDLSKIIIFLKNSVLNCQVDTESDLAVLQKLLGPDLRHGPEIFREISEIVDSLLTEGGKYDPVYLIRDFLKNPWEGCSEICRKAIEEACKCLSGNKRYNPEYQRTWCVGDFLEIAGISTDGIDSDILTQELHIYQDDGMGYGAVNGPCIAIERKVDDETGQSKIGIWM